MTYLDFCFKHVSIEKVVQAIKKTTNWSKFLELVFIWQQHSVLAAALLGTQNIVNIYLELYIIYKNNI